MEALNINMEKSNRKLAREKATIGIYQHLLVGSSIEDIDAFLQHDEELVNQKNIDFALWLVNTTLNSMDSYIALLSKHLKSGWTFDRLSPMERAILLIATCEILESDDSPKVIINEAVLNAKKFCDDKSYKFINGVLSNLV